MVVPSAVQGGVLSTSGGGSSSGATSTGSSGIAKSAGTSNVVSLAGGILIGLAVLLVIGLI